MPIVRHPSDWRTVAYMVGISVLLVVNWNLPSFHLGLWALQMFMAVSVAVIAHNHNHLGTFRSRRLNALMDYWITLFYGFPAFAWVPTHNMNHHKYTNDEGDATATWRLSERNNLLTLLIYPFFSAWWQRVPTRQYLARLWRSDRRRFWHCVSQYAVIVLWVAGALWLDVRKGLLYVVAPSAFALYTILVFNYLQHVHTDEKSQYNHSRNVTGRLLNLLLFNNGYHTVHHLKPGLHWSRLPEEHAKIAGKIHPSLNERSFLWLLLRTYILSLFVPRWRSRSLRLQRMAREREAATSGAQEAAMPGAAE